jgi:uncharacterized protein (DUF983 family)
MHEFQNNEVLPIFNKEERGNPVGCVGEVGSTCPACKQGKLEYNSLLNLICPKCGYESTASFT